MEASGQHVAVLVAKLFTGHHSGAPGRPLDLQIDGLPVVIGRIRTDRNPQDAPGGPRRDGQRPRARRVVRTRGGAARARGGDVQRDRLAELHEVVGTPFDHPDRHLRVPPLMGRVGRGLEIHIGARVRDDDVGCAVAGNVPDRKGRRLGRDLEKLVVLIQVVLGERDPERVVLRPRREFEEVRPSVLLGVVAVGGRQIGVQELEQAVLRQRPREREPHGHFLALGGRMGKNIETEGVFVVVDRDAGLFRQGWSCRASRTLPAGWHRRSAPGTSHSDPVPRPAWSGSRTRRSSCPPGP